MDRTKLELSQRKYKLPYHWIRDPLDRYSLPYFGYARIILDELPPTPAQVLDAGCGDGRIASEMVKRGYRVTGIDYLDVSASYARLMVPEGRFFSGDLCKDLVENYGLEEGQFAAVSMVEVYEHIPPEDCPIVLANVQKVLCPGGMLIISVPNKRLPLSKLHYRHFDQAEFEEELENAGFYIKKIIYQHNIGQLTNWILGDEVEKFLNNRWLQPIFLKRLRQSWYMKYANVTSDSLNCGRFIAIVER